MLLFVKFGDNLLYSRIHLSGKKIIVGNKRFKLEKYLLKRDGRDLPRIAIKAERKSLCGLCLALRRGTRGRLNRTVCRQDMIDTRLGVRVNLRVFGVVEVLLEPGYSMGQLKNLAGRGRKEKKRRHDA